jgi:NTE family protein
MRMDWLRRILLRRGEVPMPGVGLALGGGGVRGFAHFGVLSVLTQASIPVKAIAGTSMGAIIGAIHALNPECSGEELIEQMAELDLSVPRSLAEAKRKKDFFLSHLYQFITTQRFLMDIFWGWGVLPETGIVEVLKRLTLGKRIEESRIPLAVVSVDLKSGARIVIRDGEADLAIRASSALPGFLPPVHSEEYLLADGGFIDLVPVDIVQEMNGDPVVAVDVDQERDHVEVHNGLEAFIRAVEISARHNKHYCLEKAALVIRPDFGEPVGTLDFTKIELCLNAGVNAGRKALPEVRALIDGT